jgi:hypothetical protein
MPGYESFAGEGTGAAGKLHTSFVPQKRSPQDDKCGEWSGEYPATGFDSKSKAADRSVRPTWGLRG